MGKKQITIFLIVAVVFWAAVATWAVTTKQQGSGVDPLYPSVHSDCYLQPAYFAKFDGNAKTVAGTVSGAILPHPRQNPNAAAEALATLAKSQFGNQILLVTFAPGVGRAPVTGDYSWQTPFGIVSPSYNQMQYLASAGAAVNNPLLGTVEDLGLTMVYLKYHLGDVKVTPLLLDVNLTAAEMEAVLSPLSFAGENTTVLLLPAYSEQELPLPFNDNLAWGETLASGNGLLSGDLDPAALQSVMAASVLLPDDADQILSLFYAKNRELDEEHFSDLLLFYGKSG